MQLIFQEKEYMIYGERRMEGRKKERERRHREEENEEEQPKKPKKSMVS